MPWAKQQRCGNHVEAIKHLTDLTVVQVAAARERVAAGSTVAGIVTSRVVPLSHCSGQANNRKRWGPWMLREVVGEQRQLRPGWRADERAVVTSPATAAPTPPTPRSSPSQHPAKALGIPRARSRPRRRMPGDAASQRLRTELTASSPG